MTLSDLLVSRYIVGIVDVMLQPAAALDNPVAPRNTRGQNSLTPRSTLG